MPVPLGGRALDILAVLLETPGQFVSKDTLIARVWPCSVVEENDLRVHIAALRRALDGRRYILNEPQRGYCLVAPLQEAAGNAAPRHNLATRLSPLIGRDELVGDAGPTPVGATPDDPHRRRWRRQEQPGAGVGRACCRRVIATACGGWIWPVSIRPRQCCATWPRPSGSTRLTVARHSSVNWPRASYCWCSMAPTCCSAPAVIWCARCRPARLRVTLCSSSREALRVPGEWVQRVPRLALPMPSAWGSVEQAMAYSAVQVFVARVRGRSARVCPAAPGLAGAARYLPPARRYSVGPRTGGGPGRCSRRAGLAGAIAQRPASAGARSAHGAGTPPIPGGGPGLVDTNA